jgi:hypothetical protein
MAQLDEEKTRSWRLAEEREREHSRELERLMLTAGTWEKKARGFYGTIF